MSRTIFIAAARVGRGIGPARCCAVIARRRASTALTRTGSPLISGQARAGKDPLDPRGRTQQTPVVAGTGDELQPAREAMRAEAGPDRERGGAQGRPAR